MFHSLSARLSYGPPESKSPVPGQATRSAAGATTSPASLLAPWLVPSPAYVPSRPRPPSRRLTLSQAMQALEAALLPPTQETVTKLRRLHPLPHQPMPPWVQDLAVEDPFHLPGSLPVAGIVQGSQELSIGAQWDDLRAPTRPIPQRPRAGKRRRHDGATGNTTSEHYAAQWYPLLLHAVSKLTLAAVTLN